MARRDEAQLVARGSRPIALSPMIEHRGTLISEDLFEKRFVCDLNACKGA